VFPVGNWFEGSQVSKARPGAPFDFTRRYCTGHKLCQGEVVDRQIAFLMTQHTFHRPPPFPLSSRGADSLKREMTKLVACALSKGETDGCPRSRF
jgi:hypothetical protein